MIRKLMAAVALTAMLLMTGCASVPMANKDADAKAKLFTPSQGKMANLYIYRSEVLGAAIKMPVLIDGRSAGDTAARVYIFKTLPAGSHNIVSKAENDSSLTIDMQAGQTYFVWQEVKMGVLYARSKLHLVDEETGEAGVRECSLIKGDDSSDESVAAAPGTTNATVPITPPAATPVVATAAPTPHPVIETKPQAADPAPQALAAAPADTAPLAAEPPAESAASAAIEPIAQSVATELGCGAVQASGATTFIVPCGTYSVLIDCDGGQCRPMHTVNVKHDQ